MDFFRTRRRLFRLFLPLSLSLSLGEVELEERAEIDVDFDRRQDTSELAAQDRQCAWVTVDSNSRRVCGCVRWRENEVGMDL